jgi:nitric oxide reductase NorE protein
MTESPRFLRGAPAPAQAPASWRPLAVDGGRRAAPVTARVPGEAGIWVFILGDMLIFGLFFAAFLVQRGQHADLFAQSRETMTVAFGAVNTIVLLTSSLFVATAVRAHRAGRRIEARNLVALTGACAATFAVIKVAEWGIKLHAGYAPGDDLFYTYYYVLTAVHFLHLSIGSVVLAYWWRLMRRPQRPTGERRIVECCASYWHMVDLLWVVLFPVLYLSAT